MDWKFEDVVSWFERIYSRTLEVAQAIPEDKINWKPGKTEFSCGDIVRHIASAELMNVSRLETKKLVYKGHGEEYGRSKDAVVEYLEKCHTQALEILNRLGEPLLMELVPTNQGQIEGWRVIAGLVEHEIHHRSQLCSYLSTLGVVAPPLFGIYVEDLPTV